jgi:prolyl oligopeptidase
MQPRTWLGLLLLVPGFVSAHHEATVTYPQTRRVDIVDDYFGRKVPDPYRWLEDPDSPETRAWIEAQNRVTFDYLAGIPERESIRGRLTELWNYERYGVPSREGPWYVFARNDGLQNQSVIYRAASLAAPPEVLIDPNTFSPDGTVALGSLAFSDDGRYVAYSVSTSGSDWREWRVREVATATDLPDRLQWSKFSGAAWRKDGSGFFYSRYDAPEAGAALQQVNKNQKVYFHRLGTPQEQDELVYARPDRPDWMFEAEVTEDGRFLLIYQSESTDPKNRVFLQDLSVPGSRVEPFLDAYDAEYGIVGNDGDLFYVLTDNGAPRRRLVAIDRKDPAPSRWRTIIAEGRGREVLAEVRMAGDRFVAVWLTDAHHTVKIYRLDGRLEREVALAGLGAIGGLSAKRRYPDEVFYSFTSFTTPTTIFRYDVSRGRSSVFRQPKVAFRPSDFETIQVFYPSKDGTRIPMFLSYRKGLRKDGRTPTLLYGYGGFNIALTPSFSPATIAWLEMGGIYAVANLRGGGEYGKAWHDAGRLHNKQNVFDDFIAAAEYLVRERYTSPAKLAIHGASNGGLLVGACLVQRPDLFGAALPAVGVMDMLRFHKFTIGWAWVSDYGNPDKPEDFATLIRYSPYHNIKPGVRYPATLVTTADHDDRVVPAHSFKFAAALQAAQAGPAPILIRIQTKTGHGGGRPTWMQIDERADMWAFLVHALKMTVPSAPSSAAAGRR